VVIISLLILTYVAHLGFGGVETWNERWVGALLSVSRPGSCRQIIITSGVSTRICDIIIVVALFFVQFKDHICDMLLFCIIDSCWRFGCLLIYILLCELMSVYFEVDYLVRLLCDIPLLPLMNQVSESL
jgi:hypothetical protein